MKGLFAGFVAFAALACGQTWTAYDDASITAFSFELRVGPPGDGNCEPLLPARADCRANCELLVVHANETNQASGCAEPGASQPSEATLGYFRQSFLAALGDASAPVPVVCVHDQLVGGNASSVAQSTACTNNAPNYAGTTCTNTNEPGWCYVMGAANTGGCPSAIAFGQPLPTGTMLLMNCIE